MDAPVENKLTPRHAKSGSGRAGRLRGLTRPAGSSNAAALIALALISAATLLMVYSGFRDRPPVGEMVRAPTEDGPGERRGTADPFSTTTAPPPDAVIAEEPRATPRGDDTAPAPGVGDAGVLVDESTLPQASAADLPAAELPAFDRASPAGGDPLQEAEDAEPDGELTILGRVRNRTGEPVNGIEVAATARSLFDESVDSTPPAQKSRRARSGADGGFRFERLAAGEYQLSTAATADYQAARATVRAGVEDAVLLLEPLERELQIYGSVFSTRNEPLEGVRVAPVGQSSGRAKTDDAGTYELAYPLAARRPEHTLLFTLAGYREQRQSLAESALQGARAVRVDAWLEPVDAYAEVSGIVTAADSGERISGQAVQLSSMELRQRYYATTGADGEFVMQGVESGTDYSLSLHPQGPYRDYRTSDLRVAPEGLYLDVALEPINEGTLSGQMTDTDGTPVPGFTLWLKSTGGVNQTPLTVTGDGSGYYRVHGAPAGDLVFETRSQPLFSITNIRLAPGAAEEVPLVLDWGVHRILGQVLDDAGNAIPGADIKVSWFHRKRGDRDGVRSHSWRDTVSDANGRFSFANLGPGLHLIAVYAPGFKNVTIRHDVSYGAGEVVVRIERE